MIDVAHVQSLVDELWNNHNLDVIDELYAENFVGHDPHNPRQGRDGMREWVKEAWAGSSDFHINLHETFAEGDMAVSRWTATGTHDGDWLDIPATGEHFVVTGITMSKFHDGKIVESWVNADNLGMLQQLGIIPSEMPT